VDARDKRGHDESGMAIFASETADFEFQTATYLPATEFRPGDPKALSLFQSEGAGNAGRTARPQPCVQNEKAHKQSHRRFARYVPAFPARMVLTVSFVLSLVSRACCHHHLQDHHLTGLISASGYQDHTTSPSAYPCIRLPHHKRPPHPAPNVL
jgi:hypothetical protein